MRTKPDQEDREGRKFLRRSADKGVLAGVAARTAEHFAFDVHAKPVRDKLAAAAVTCALLGAGGAR
jgi:hypothetical protein